MNPINERIPDVVPAGRMGCAAQPVLHIADAGLTLRPWRQEDAPALAAAWQDPAIRQWNRPPTGGVEQARERIARYGRRWHEEAAATWGITRADDDSVLGSVALGGMDLRQGTAEYIYWVLPAARGAGVALHATNRVARWAFRDLGLHRLELTHGVANTASCRVAEKAGFALEGTKRSATLHADGWHDMHLHARVDG
ncbi:GNAT family N-acetyltransferase [Streptomyces sp. RPT161]|uniref:GNAT family N-acetyltransferase n=1 Tax=Streptomyces sp. RPT161 TaxID=3015993 RepID=UPI0022B8647B|nr:GNAT family N-acetyltransferase [Streptomyces sp. RPT161]